MGDTFQQSQFETNALRAEFFAGQVRRVRETSEPFRLLDVGCGTGGHILRLAGEFGAASFHGVDISPGNVRSAREACAERGGNATFEEADFLAWRGEAADVVISDSTLHLIPGDTQALARALGRAVRPGGTLLFSMPSDCLRNRALFLVRRLAGAVRGPWLDALILRVAKAVYGGSGFDESALRDRIAYMYIIPERVYGARFRALLEAQSFRLVECEKEPQRYLLKPAHVFCRFDKTA